MSDAHLVDARGLRCPLPVLALARAARSLPVGATVTLLATDPAADPDVRAWARLRGHEVLAVSAVPDQGDTGAARPDEEAAARPDEAATVRLVVRLSR